MNRPQPRQRPEFHQLEVFLKAVETGSFAAAARQLARSQPAVSQAIARLEEICGGNLFQRRPGAPLILTQMGKDLVPTARMLLHGIDEQMARAARMAQGQRETLTVGINCGLAAGPLREGLADFIAARPEVRLRLVEGPPGDLHRRFSEHALDLMIVALMPDLANTIVVQETLWMERLVIALHEGHALAGRPMLEWDDVASLRLILGRSQGPFDWRALLARAGIGRLDDERHDVSGAALLDMVAMGVGATLSFASAVPPRPGIAIRPIAGADGLVAVDGIRRRGDRNPLRHKLLACIRKRVVSLASAAYE